MINFDEIVDKSAEVSKTKTVMFCLLPAWRQRVFTFSLKKKKGFPWWSSGCDFAFQCRGCGFDPLVGELDPTCFVAKKPKHRTEAMLYKFNKDFKKWFTSKKKIFKKIFKRKE